MSLLGPHTSSSHLNGSDKTPQAAETWARDGCFVISATELTSSRSDSPGCLALDPERLQVKLASVASLLFPAVRADCADGRQ
ncbi:hypothetical protein PsYK624_008960 [Phanerochaete sordida]|uniref:Uncharacterized protein n=1 Tax=Phanerochaete sordida TaxID=48140 RepID=A0A9P3L7D5_9APHY|nr:hypothetical protein PsYK624_008960 [Phanerochaete sordida]